MVKANARLAEASACMMDLQTQAAKLCLPMCKQELCTKHADDSSLSLLHDMRSMSKFSSIKLRRQASKQCSPCPRVLHCLCVRH